MSDGDTIDPADDSNFIAGEYVLGVLGATKRRKFERCLARQPALASAVAFWEGRLGRLADAVAPVPPPEGTWSRIETAIATMPRAPLVWQSVSCWRGLAMVSAALAAASIAALASGGLVPGARAPLTATLSSVGGQPNFGASVTATAR